MFTENLPLARAILSSNRSHRRLRTTAESYIRIGVTCAMRALRRSAPGAKLITSRTL